MAAVRNPPSLARDCLDVSAEGTSRASQRVRVTMRELISESRECNVCGSRVQVACGASDLGARAGTFVESFDGGRPARVTRERSGLAHAAGFAGVVYLFLNSLAMYLLPIGRSASAGLWLVVGCDMFAPLAVVLAFAAAVSLQRSHAKAGVLPALFGLLVGLWGTCGLLLLLASWLRHLNSF